MAKSQSSLSFDGLLSGLKDLIYPKICLVCKQKLSGCLADSFVCAKCWGKIKKNIPPFCHFCGRHLKNINFAKHICPGCLKKTLHFDRAFSPCVYEGVMKSLIHEFKYNGKDYLGFPLSRLMIDFIREYDISIDFLDYIIPVPLHPARFREREFNQAEILSSHIAKEFNKEVLNNNLIRHRYTSTQTELETEKRYANVSASFSVKESSSLKSKNILLVDDVLTTGATSSWAAYALKDAGAGVVFVLTLTN
jgi:competence protein ComFC